MGIVVGIGGGEFRLRETLDMDKEIVRLTGKYKPTALFLPTASGDSESYSRMFIETYGELLGCATNVLHIANKTASPREIESAILSSDLVYVGGGNTLKMMRRWRRLGLDAVLRTAFDQGVLLSGISAGAMCWFKAGHSDSLRFYNSDNWRFIAVAGLGLIDATLCPHYDQPWKGGSRKASFQTMVARRGGTGIALDNNCAIVFKDGRYKIIATTPRSSAYMVFKSKGKMITFPLQKGRWFQWQEPNKKVQLKSNSPELTPRPDKSRLLYEG